MDNLIIKFSNLTDGQYLLFMKFQINKKYNIVNSANPGLGLHIFEFMPMVGTAKYHPVF